MGRAERADRSRARDAMAAFQEREQRMEANDSKNGAPRQPLPTDPPREPPFRKAPIDMDEINPDLNPDLPPKKEKRWRHSAEDLLGEESLAMQAAERVNDDSFKNSFKQHLL